MDPSWDMELNYLPKTSLKGAFSCVFGYKSKVTSRVFLVWNQRLGVIQRFALPTHKKKKSPVGRAVGPPDPTSKSGNTRRRTYSPAIRRRTWCWKRSQSHRRDRETWCFFFFGRSKKKTQRKKGPKGFKGWIRMKPWWKGQNSTSSLALFRWGVSGTGHTSKHASAAQSLKPQQKGNDISEFSRA